MRRTCPAVLLALSWLPLACQSQDGGGLGPVVISEIMYHPIADEPHDDHEFIEIANRTDERIALAGWKFVSGIQFSFPAGTTLPPRGHLVVAKNRRKLLEVRAYELDEAQVIGEYQGGLDNDGERLVLQDAKGGVSDELRYADAFPWPIAADALGAADDFLPEEILPLENHRYMGHSLERVSLDGPSQSVANWMASPLDGATPGRPNAARGEPRPVVQTIALTPSGQGDTPLGATDRPRLRVTFSAVGPLRLDDPAVEYFVEDLERNDEPRARVTLVPTTKDPLVFEARLPPQPEGSVVRYRIVGDRGEGMGPIAPRPFDPNLYFAYFVSPPEEGRTPIYRLFIAKRRWETLWDNIEPGRMPGNLNGTNPFQCKVNERWNAREPAVFVAGGRVFDVSVRYQGSHQGRTSGASINAMKWPAEVPRPDRPSSFRALGWSIKFPRYDRFEGVRSFNLNKLIQGCQGFNTAVANTLFERAGIPAAQTRYVRFFINGAYYHYMQRFEHMDEHMLRRFYGKGDQGDLFKSVGGRWDEGPYGWADARPLEPYCGYSLDERYAWTYDRMNHRDYKRGGSEMQKLIEDLDAARKAGLPAIRKFFEETFALEELTNYLAVMNWVVGYDDQYHNHFLYRRLDGRWMLMPTDMDNTMGGASPALPDASFFTGVENVRSNRNEYWNRIKDAYLRAFRDEFIARLQELDRTVLAPDTVAEIMDQVAAQYAADEAESSPTGPLCGGRWQEAIERIKNFAIVRSARIRLGLFD